MYQCFNYNVTLKQTNLLSLFPFFFSKFPNTQQSLHFHKESTKISKMNGLLLSHACFSERPQLCRCLQVVIPAQVPARASSDIAFLKASVQHAFTLPVGMYIVRRIYLFPVLSALFKSTCQGCNCPPDRLTQRLYYLKLNVIKTRRLI